MSSNKYNKLDFLPDWLLGKQAEPQLELRHVYPRLRWISRVLMLFLCALLAFAYWQKHGAEPSAPAAPLLANHEVDNDLAQSLAVALEVERQAIVTLKQDLLILREQIADKDRQLQRYQQLIESGADLALRIAKPSLKTLGERRYQFSIDVRRLRESKRRFNGVLLVYLTVRVSDDQTAATQRLPISSFSSAPESGINLGFKSFQTVTEEFKLPSELMPMTLDFEVISDDGTRLSSLSWPWPIE